MTTAKKMFGQLCVPMQAGDVHHCVALVVPHAQIEVFLTQQCQDLVVWPYDLLATCNMQRSVSSVVLNIDVRNVGSLDEQPYGIVGNEIAIL